MVFMVFIGVIFLLLYLHNFVLLAEICVIMKQHLILLFLLLLLQLFLFFVGLNYGTLEIKRRVLPADLLLWTAPPGGGQGLQV